MPHPSTFRRRIIRREVAVGRDDALGNLFISRPELGEPSPGDAGPGPHA